MIGVWAGLAVLTGVAAGLEGWFVLPVLTAGAWFALRGSIGNRRRRAIVIFLLGFLMVVSMGRATLVPPVPSLVPVAHADRFAGRIVSPVQSDLRYQGFEVELSRLRIGDVWSETTGTVRVTAPASDPLAFGDRIGFTGDLEPAEDSEEGYRAYLLNRRLSGSVFARSAWVDQPGHGPRRALFDFGAGLAERLRRAVPGDAGILLGGLVVGDDSALSDETARAFRLTGLSHITAVSGSNLALVVVLLMAAGRPVPLRWRMSWLAVVIAAVWLYAWITGLDPPVVRAALMASIALAARPFGRRPDYLTAASLSAAVMAMQQPALIHDVGFQLSLSASVALAALAAGAFVATSGGAVRLAIDGAIVAQLATIPVTVAAFGVFSPVSIVVNVIVGPLVAIAFPTAFIGAFVAGPLPAPGAAVIGCAGWFSAAIIHIVGFFAALPVASTPLPSIPLTGQFGLITFSAVTVLLLSRDGRRWLMRALSGPPPAVAPPVGKDDVSLTAGTVEGIVSPGPHSLAAQDVTLSR